MTPEGKVLDLAYAGLLDHVSEVLLTTLRILKLCTLAVAAHEKGQSLEARLLANEAADLEYDLCGSCDATGRIVDLVEPQVAIGGTDG